MQHLRQLMRHVVQHAQEAAAKGVRARERMASRFSTQHVARLLGEALEGAAGRAVQLQP